MNNPTPPRQSRRFRSVLDPSEHERLIARLLSDPRKAEAMKWLKKVRSGEERTIGRRRTTATSAKLVQKLYNLGASEVIAAQIRPARKGNGQHTGKLLVRLPKDQEHRKESFDWCERQRDSFGYSPSLDRGERYLFLLLD